MQKGSVLMSLQSFILQAFMNSSYELCFLLKYVIHEILFVVYHIC